MRSIGKDLTSDTELSNYLLLFSGGIWLGGFQKQYATPFYPEKACYSSLYINRFF